MSVKCASLVLFVSGWSSGCAWYVHAGEPLHDTSDPGYLDIERGSHELSHSFGYRIAGGLLWGERTLSLFHRGADGARETLGEIPLDGWRFSVNEREAAFALADDGRSLLYLHAPSAVTAGEKVPGLYLFEEGVGERLLREGATVIPTSVPPLLTLPLDALVFLPEHLELGWYGDAELRTALVRTLAGVELPLLAWDGNALHRALCSGDLAALEHALAQGTEREARNAVGMTPLHLAVCLEQAEAVRALLAINAELEARVVLAGIDSGTTPLLLALGGGAEEIVDLLLAAGADVNAVSREGVTPLHAVLRQVEGEEMWRLLSRTEPPDGAGRVRKLLAAGARTEARDSTGNTALHRAARCGRADVVAELLVHGANANAVGRKGAKPLDYAPTPEVAQLLREHGARGTAPCDEAPEAGRPPASARVGVFPD